MADERDVAAAVERLRKRPWLTTADYEDFCAVCDALTEAEALAATLARALEQLSKAHGIVVPALADPAVQALLKEKP